MRIGNWYLVVTGIPRLFAATIFGKLRTDTRITLSNSVNCALIFDDDFNASKIISPLALIIKSTKTVSSIASILLN